MNEFFRLLENSCTCMRVFKIWQGIKLRHLPHFSFYSDAPFLNVRRNTPSDARTTAGVVVSIACESTGRSAVTNYFMLLYFFINVRILVDLRGSWARLWPYGTWVFSLRESRSFTLGVCKVYIFVCRCLQELFASCEDVFPHSCILLVGTVIVGLRITSSQSLGGCIFCASHKTKCDCVWSNECPTCIQGRSFA